MAPSNPPPPPPPPPPETNKVSLATARCIPVFIAAVVVYVSYTITGPLSISYIIGEQHRLATGIAVTVAWFVLVVPVAVAWARLLSIVFGDSGFVPRGEDVGDGGAREREAGLGLEAWWGRDVFVCTCSSTPPNPLKSSTSEAPPVEKKSGTNAPPPTGTPSGLPIWCQPCQAYKPDRAHHNQDTARCTLKMDHFCPWVGGVVGERSLKPFLQFLVYSCLLSLYAMILLAYYVHQRKHGRVLWLVALGLTAFFVFFTLGIVFNTLHMMVQNMTSVEAIDAESRTMLLAVALPPGFSPERLVEGAAAGPQGEAPPSRSGESERPLTSDLDDPAHNSYFAASGAHPPARKLARSRYWKGTVTYPLAGMLPTDRPPLPAPESRTFAILETPPGLNPWDLGSPGRNLRAVLGLRWWEWGLPWRVSPCCEHGSGVSFYPMGPQFVGLLEEVGLLRVAEGAERVGGGGGEKREGRARKRRLERGWQHGERPDGWISDKEARRTRNQGRVAGG
ncbi:hypothetical protein LTR08_002386 [Meristemomyces frigidus]|nr:hypothetical protein LTR08_002386 [Meristemomyces frigidus]